MASPSIKLVLVPVATIGCGKTTTAQTLLNLFPDHFGAVANDDMPAGKNGKSLFIRRAFEILKEKPIVIMDRNNHMWRERQQIFDDFKKLRAEYLQEGQEIKFVCLSFLGTSARSKELWNVTTERVLTRGDNHQSIKVEKDGEDFVKKIMSGFVSRFQPVDARRQPDSLFDLLIRLCVNDETSSLKNAQTIAQKIQNKYKIFGPSTAYPSTDEWDRGFKRALVYTPDYSKDMGKKSKASTSKKQLSNAPQYENVLEMLSPKKSE